MIAGHLRVRNGHWHMVLSYDNEYGKRIQKSVTTHLKEKGNKKRAEAMLQELRRKTTAEQSANRNSRGIYADAYFLHWLESVKSIVSPTTYKSYSMIVRNSICPYFRERDLLLNELKPKHIAAYYDSLLDRGLSTTTARRHHANIRKALERAVIDGLIIENPAKRVEPPKVVPYTASYYSKVECQQLMSALQGNDNCIAGSINIASGITPKRSVGTKMGSC